MAITVVTDPLDPLLNSYVSLAEVEEYLTDRVPDESVLTAWQNLDPPVQAGYVVNASRSIDMMVEWIGDRYSRDQKLHWPRYNAFVDGYSLDVTTFPTAVKEATIEMLIWSMGNDGVVSVTRNSEFNSIKVGPIAIDFNENAIGSVNQYFPDIIAYILRDYGTLQNPNLPGQNQLKTVRLMRA